MGMGTNVDVGGQDGGLAFFARADARSGSALLEGLLDRRATNLGPSLAAIERTGQLGALGDAYERAAGLDASAIARMLASGRIPGPLSMPRPSSVVPRGAERWAEGRATDLARSRAPLARALAASPELRAELERALGGRIVDADGAGTLSVEAFAPGLFPGGGRSNAAALHAGEAVDALGRASRLAPGADGASSAYHAMLAQGMARVLGLDAAALGGGLASAALPDAGLATRRRYALAEAPLAGAGSAMPAMVGAPMRATVGAPMQAVGAPLASTAQAMGAATGSYLPGGVGIPLDAGVVLADPSLTVEDKVCLMLMVIMKQMDQQIEQQANYINKLQQQQQGGGKGGKGGGGGSGPSIDVETMKLKRLIDKRSQMFDMLRQIIDKYNQTAKGIIDSMGR
jgi:hypothetical protein